MVVNLLKMMYIMRIIYTFKHVYLRLILYLTVLLFSLMFSLHIEAILVLFFAHGFLG